MIRTNSIRILLSYKPIIRRKSDAAINIEKLEQENALANVIDEELINKEAEIEHKRNKSRLRDHDRNFLFERMPYKEPQLWTHGTLKYTRKMYGRYGEASGVNQSLCWPTKQELADKIEYEHVAYPQSILKMVEEAKIKRAEKEKRIQTRQQDIIKKMEKLEQWKKDLKNKIQKKESEALAAKESKERLVEEVRRHFGYRVDPRDDKFKEMLEKKEKEQKKAMKEAKKKAKEERMINVLLNKQVEDTNKNTKV
ncbi:hypothetical protein ILUMI_05171 [Ignelater luminosus]|uniref:Large ribosomal subunit protein mL64 n=1 Tax=Ignelater luminosus TaxID=2038154 RepID=A0A8K0DBJ1_IGNLU|nr:hypothetical protein ILUMI_05171 [Ignelater luminosus]